MTDAARAARQMWTLFEPVHAVTYFAPEARSAFADAGLRGFWRGYFAGRAAPLGRVGAAPVTAAFFSFAPAMVARALPAIWDLITPEAALQARSAGAVAALARLLSDQDLRGPAAPSPAAPALSGQNGDLGAAAAAAASLLTGVIDGIDCAGRVLAAANAALPVPGEPLARLWQAVTVLREHRGDGHVAALVAAGLDGCEALVMRAGMDLSREVLQPGRGWADDAWDLAASRLADRGWLGPDGRVTAEGASAHSALERATDLAAGVPATSLEPRLLAGRPASRVRRGSRGAGRRCLPGARRPRGGRARRPRPGLRPRWRHAGRPCGRCCAAAPGSRSAGRSAASAHR